MNPSRECGLCRISENEQPPIAALIGILPNIDNYRRTEIDKFGFKSEHFDGFDEMLHERLHILRETVNGCPACIMAALRQAKIPVPMATEFDYKKELEAFWKEQNTEREPYEY